jgi:hypothetical protein
VEQLDQNAALHIVRFNFNFFHDNTPVSYDGNKDISAVRLNMRIRAGAFHQVRYEYPHQSRASTRDSRAEDLLFL